MHNEHDTKLLSRSIHTDTRGRQSSLISQVWLFESEAEVPTPQNSFMHGMTLISIYHIQAVNPAHVCMQDLRKIIDSMFMLTLTQGCYGCRAEPYAWRYHISLSLFIGFITLFLWSVSSMTGVGLDKIIIASKHYSSLLNL